MQRLTIQALLRRRYFVVNGEFECRMRMESENLIRQTKRKISWVKSVATQIVRSVVRKNVRSAKTVSAAAPAVRVQSQATVAARNKSFSL